MTLLLRRFKSPQKGGVCLEILMSISGLKGISFMEFDALFSKRSTHIKPGLERIARSYEYLARPAKDIPSVLIGGTNGKGSTSGFLWSLIAANQLEAALFTSPHLAAFSERFQLSLQPTSDAEISTYIEHLKESLTTELYDELSFFEATTLIAFQLFAERQARFQVLEVGLGGRWDATNISDPAASVLVSVSLDHAEYLGSDLEGILREKLGIMRQGRPFFWGGGGEILELPQHRSIIEEEAKAKGAQLIVADEHFAFDEAAACIRLNLPNLAPLTLALTPHWQGLPRFLLKNLSLAAAVYCWLSQRESAYGLLPLAEVWDNFLEGKQASPVSLIGRCQRLSAGPGSQKFLVDVCHNPDGARNFVASVKARRGEQGRPLGALVSVLRDKDYDLILDILRSAFQPVMLFGIEHTRAWEPEILASRHRDLPFFPNFQAALDALQGQKGSSEPRPWAVCGSVLAVGQVLQSLDVSPKDMHVARVIGGDWPWADLQQS